MSIMVVWHAVDLLTIHCNNKRLPKGSVQLCTCKRKPNQYMNHILLFYEKLYNRHTCS